MNKQDTRIKNMKQKVLEETRAFNTISQILGIHPLLIKNQTVKPHSIYQKIYVSIILIFFLIELAYVVVYQEIVMSSHYSITNLTHIFNLLAENIISCVCLIMSVTYSKEAFEDFKSCLKGLTIFSQLNMDLDFRSMKKISMIYITITYGVIYLCGFTIDFILVFGDGNENYFSFTSWAFLVFHLCYNAFAMLYLVILLKILQLRFKALNSVMKDFNSISEQNLLSEMKVLGLEKSKPDPYTLPERVRMIKEAHDRLYRVCVGGWISQNHIALLEIVTSGILITSYLYSILGMVIDQQVDYALITYCCYWTSYRALVIVILVLSYDGVCKECNQMALVVHEILNRGETKEVYIQLKNFSLQRLHQKLKIMACGLFAIDRSLLFEISGAITNHLVILIQFKMLGVSNNPQKSEKGISDLLNK